MTDAPFTPSNFDGPGLNGEHMAALAAAARPERMDQWVGQIAAGLAGNGQAPRMEDDYRLIANRAWNLAAALERQREAVLIDMQKEDA